MRKTKVKKGEKPVRILIYSFVSILLIGVTVLFIFSDTILQYVSDKAKEKGAKPHYYEETRARREEKERIEDENQRENGTGKYAQEIEFKYDNNNTGKVVFILTGKNRGIEVRFQEGRTLKTYCSWMRLDAVKTIKLEGNDYEDLYFQGVSGGSGGYSVIHNILNTKRGEIISYSTDWFDNDTGKWTKSIYKSDNFLNEEFSNERKYLEEILGSYIQESKSPEYDSKNGTKKVERLQKIVKEP